jgi:hypothetical protein
VIGTLDFGPTRPFDFAGFLRPAIALGAPFAPAAFPAFGAAWCPLCTRLRR